MATIGKLSVTLGLNSAKFTKGIATASKRIKAFGAGLGNVIKKVVKFGTVMVAAGAAGMALLTRESLKTMDATAKLADRIGDTTEAIAGLSHAAEITGAGTETMLKALDMLPKRLGEVKLGTGEAKEALKALGLNIDDLIKMKPSEAFGEIAESMSKFSSQSMKVVVATMLFGRTGMALVNTLSLGKKGLAEMNVEATKLGLTFSRKMAAKAEEANDAIQRLKSLFIGLGNVLAVKVAPFITAVADKFTEMAVKAGGLGPLMTKALSPIVKVLAFIADGVQITIRQFRMLGFEIIKVADFVVKMNLKIAKMAANLPDFLGGGLAAKNVKGLEKALVGLARIKIDIGKKIIAARDAPLISQRAKELFDDIVSKANKAARDIAKASKPAAKGFLGNLAAGLAGKTSGAFKGIFDRIQNIKALIEKTKGAGGLEVAKGGASQIERRLTALPGMGGAGVSRRTKKSSTSDEGTHDLLRQLILAVKGGVPARVA